MNSGQLQPITIIIPAFNETESIGSVLVQLKKECADFVSEIIVVNDGSTDNTQQVVEELDIHLINHPRNLGYGAALKTGIKNAKTDFVLTMDSDGQHKVSDVISLWELQEGYDMVVGQRTSLVHSPLWRMPGKWFLGSMANYLTSQSIPDLNSGLRLMRRDVVLRYMHLCPSGFSFSTTITMALLSQGYNVLYTPIQVEKRTGKSTVSFSTGLETLILVLRIATLFNPLKIFIPTSFLIGIVGEQLD
ncbi:MAG: hypothetical protein B6242_17310 [Anaerolineaceae bacterium 4572_78]|nr:MAG: hypothetical protein B6242_17310 [Anaerolineaceae bacterium 4572_78]